MTSIELEIRNPSGLHARPAAEFVKAARRFASDLHVRNLLREGAEADAKSILGVLALGVGRGGRVELIADGSDEAEAVETLRRLVDDGLGEPLGEREGSGAA